jgi:uncharacterized protein
VSDSSAVLALTALVAGLMKGFTGFGGALVMAPLFTLVLSPGQTLGTVVAVNVATGWQMLGPSWRTMQRGVVLPMAVACALATPLGIVAVLILDPAVGHRLIGAVVMASGIALLSGYRRTRPPWLADTLLVGALSGILNGLAGIGGPPAALWLLAGQEGAARDRAGLIVYVALTQAAGATLAASAGALDLTALSRALWLAPLHIAGTLAGARLFELAPERVVRLTAVGLFVVLGAITALR